MGYGKPQGAVAFLPAYDWEVMRRNRGAPVCSAVVVTGQVRGLLPGLRVPGYLLGPVVGIAAMLVLLPFLAGLLPIVHFVRERIDIAVYPEVN